VSVSSTMSKCRCKRHGEWNSDNQKITTFNFKKGKAVKRALIDYLINNGHITKDDSYVCSSCCEMVTLIMQDESKIEKHFLLLSVIS